MAFNKIFLKVTENSIMKSGELCALSHSYCFNYAQDEETQLAKNSPKRGSSWAMTITSNYFLFLIKDIIRAHFILYNNGASCLLINYKLIH